MPAIRITGSLALGLASLLEAAPQWPPSFEPLTMPFRPHDKKICRQNPPDFSWPPVKEAAGYELQVARDAGFRRIAQHRALAANFHNFAQAFETGVWHWRVRFRDGAGAWSAWTPPRRFRIAADAWAFPVPPVEELMRRVPAGHPRVWTTEAGLTEFRARAAGPRKEWFAALKRRVDADIDKPPAPEPLFPYPNLPVPQRTAEWIAAWDRLRSEGEGAAERLLRTAFVYLVSGDGRIGASAVAQMMNVAAWNADGPTGYATHDQVHRAIAWKTAVAYDWCHGLLTPGQRLRVLEMVRNRTATMVGHLVEQRPLTRRPFDSHGWTAYGYLGIIASATLRDLPDAERWFRAVVPAYINILPPWGDDDGGWCQGTAYWQYSQQSNREFFDVLLSATGFSLYDKAHTRAGALFPLYTLPHGSPRGHFGDGNDHKPGGYHIGFYRRLAQIYRDPALQWAWQVIGDRPDSQLSYYFSGDETLPARPPAHLPPSRWFRDIGWVAMHSDLIDPERVSLYFKSSPIGSFNHSHADQNAFVLNAYGEALAIDAGYYDWYGSPHDKNYARQTLAHNAITHDGGLGQPVFDATASGNITAFVHHERFDAASGDAAAAYKGALGRAARHIVYVRPETFVIVDDLAARDGAESRFEWWLNSLGAQRLDPDGSGASIEQGKARLRVRLHAPQGLDSTVTDRFFGPPDVYPAGQAPQPLRPAGRGSRWPDQVHARFQAPPSARARFVATLQTYRAGAAEPELAVEHSAGALTLRFAGGRQVIVRLNGAGRVEAAGIAFDGAAAALSGDAVLLVDGTWLERGKTVLRAARAVTAAVSPGKLSISCGDDTKVTLQGPAGRFAGELEPAWHTLALK